MEKWVKGKRSVMWFLWKQGKSGKEILREMREVYGDDCPSKSTVYLWIERFEDGWNTADDYGHQGHPISTGYRGYWTALVGISIWSPVQLI